MFIGRWRRIGEIGFRMSPSKSDWHVELFIEAGNTLGEGPIWWNQEGLLVWVDILECKIFSADASGSVVHTFEMPEPVGCVFEMPDGSLVAGCQSGLRTVPDGELIARVPDAAPNIRVNDGKVDPWGNLVFGTMGFPEPAEGMGTLWRWDGSSFSSLLGSVTIPNGMIWRPECSEFLFIDTPTKCIRTYRYDESTFQLGEPISVIDLSEFDGDPDGMCEGRGGALYIAMWDGSCLLHLMRGQGIEEVPMPVKRPTSVLYSPHRGEIFITSARSRDGGSHSTTDGGSVLLIRLNSRPEDNIS